MRRSVVFIAAAAIAAAIAGCSSAPSERAAPDPTALRVASFDFVESEVLAEIFAQSVEGVGIPVERLGAIGPREIVVPAMRNELVDLVPEYVGSALRFVGVVDTPDDPTEAASLLGDRVGEFEILVLTPSSAVDVNVFVVSADSADVHGLTSISDLAGTALTRLGGPAECPDRPFCLIGLSETYGLSFAEFVAQPSLAFTGEALRRGEIDVGVMFSTSPELNAPDLLALDDDRGLQPPENVVPMLRSDAMERWGSELESELDAVSGRLTTGDLRRMNGLVAEGAAVADVAREWLALSD